jgi:hypothetical protein
MPHVEAFPIYTVEYGGCLDTGVIYSTPTGRIKSSENARSGGMNTNEYAWTQMNVNEHKWIRMNVNESK